MGAPDFRTDTDALRWFGARCAAAGEAIDEVNRRAFKTDAVIPAEAFGGAMMRLVVLGDRLTELRESYERFRTATVNQLDNVTARLAVMETDLRRVANAYDASDHRARVRLERPR